MFLLVVSLMQIEEKLVKFCWRNSRKWRPSISQHSYGFYLISWNMSNCFRWMNLFTLTDEHKNLCFTHNTQRTQRIDILSFSPDTFSKRKRAALLLTWYNLNQVNLTPGQRGRTDGRKVKPDVFLSSPINWGFWESRGSEFYFDCFEFLRPLFQIFFSFLGCENHF